MSYRSLVAHTNFYFFAMPRSGAKPFKDLPTTTTRRQSLKAPLRGILWGCIHAAKKPSTSSSYAHAFQAKRPRGLFQSVRDQDVCDSLTDRLKTGDKSTLTLINPAA